MNPVIEKETIRDYLLGILDEARRAQLEERILSESEVYQEVSVVENELIDQHIEGDLSELEEEQFETHFLITPERQSNLRFAELLKQYVNSHYVAASQSEKAAPAQNFLSFQLAPLRRRPALVLSTAAVAILGIALIAWLVTRSATETTVQGGTPVATVVTLTPHSTRSEGVKVPPKGYDVKLQLELNNASFEMYKSELFRGNKPLKTIADLKMEANGKQHVTLTITGEILSPGDYQVRLSGVSESGTNEFIDNYSFRVIE